LFDGFQAIQRRLIAYKEGPLYQSFAKGIEEKKELIKGLSKEERAAIDKQVSGLNKEARTLEARKATRPRDVIKQINQKIKVAQAKIKTHKEAIKKAIDEHGLAVNKDIANLKNDIANIGKKITPLDAMINKLGTRLKNARARRDILTERLKKLGKETKTYAKVKDELSKSSSVIFEIEKNIKARAKEREQLKKQFSSKKKDLADAQKIKKLKPKAAKDLEKKIADLNKEIDKLKESRKPTPKEIKELEKKIKDVESKIKKLEKSKEIPEKDKKALRLEIKELEKQIADNAPKGTKHDDGTLRDVLSDDAMWASVEQTVDNITGNTDTAHLNPMYDRIMSGTSMLKSRKIPIDQIDLRPWHNTSALQVTDTYMRSMVPMLKMTAAAKRFGAKDISEMREIILSTLKKDYDTQAAGLRGKAASDFEKVYNKNIENINDTFKILMGVYGAAPSMTNAGAAQLYRNFLTWNSIRLLGYMTLSSLPDLGLQVFVNGPFRTIYHGLRHSLSSEGLSKGDLAAIGYGCESEMGSRFKSYAEHQDLSTQPGPFTRAFDELERNFGNLTLMNQWNSWQQNIAGHVSIHRTLEAVHKISAGEKVKQKERVRLAKLGINDEQIDIIAKFTEGNIDKKTGTRYADWTNWDIKTNAEAKALEQFQLATGQDIESIVLTPGLGDRPKIGHTPGS
jgi:septal ring factor EnvC (AmiA/AmiB activator)